MIWIQFRTPELCQPRWGNTGYEVVNGLTSGFAPGGEGVLDIPSEFDILVQFLTISSAVKSPGYARYCPHGANHSLVHLVHEYRILNCMGKGITCSREESVSYRVFPIPRGPLGMG